MRCFVDVVPDADGWRVRVTQEGLVEALGERRMLRVEAAAERPVPVPPADYVAELPPTAVHHALCSGKSPEGVNDLLQRLARRTAGAGDAERFGRYLFACLLGETLWSTIVDAAGDDGIELSLALPSERMELARFPWELMHGPTGFLGTIDGPRTSITRRVLHQPTDGQRQPIVIRPRVLFVIGASVTDPSIEAGAEYLGLVRRIRAGGAALTTRVLVEATPQQLSDAVRDFRPSIVHVISHGEIGADGRGRINMMSENVKGSEEPLLATQLLELLGRSGSRPPVLVLNACETGTGIDAIGTALATPLAAELVAGGIPVVIGQGGRVADRACRLFTRRFYEALLAGESLPEATAEGRRSARALGGDPSTSIDWALPSLYIADGASTSMTLDGADELRRVESLAAGMCTISNPTSFCGRLECIEHFSAMLLDSGISAVRVLAYEVAERDSEVPNPRYGKSRLLQELASHAVREGVVPCLVSFLAGDQKPKDARALGREVMRAIYRARTEFAFEPLAVPEYEMNRLDRALETADRTMLDQSVRDQLEMATPEQGHAAAVAAALRLDLARLAADAPARHGSMAPVSSVVLLVDEVHQFGDAAREFLEKMLTAEGLGTPGHPIPVVIAFSGSSVAGDSATAAQALTSYFEKGKPYVRRVLLRAFQSPIESRLAYRQYLLHQRTPLVFTDRAEDAQKIETVLSLLQQQIRGVPSKMELTAENADVQSLVKAARALGPLREASDEDALLEIQGKSWAR